MKYRFLETEEWGRLEGVMPTESIPNPLISKVAVAEANNGEIAGILVAQMTIHMEPLIINEKYRHAVRFDKLAKLLEKGLGHKRYYCFSESPIIEKMLDFIGFIKLPYNVWKRK